MRISPSRICLVLFPLLIVLLLALNFLLVRQSKELASSLAAHTRSLEPVVGAAVPPLSGNGIDGNPMTLGYPDHRKTLLLVFSPSCGMCAENWPAWQKIVRAADETAVRIALLDLSSKVTPAYVAALGVSDLPVFRQVDAKVAVDYRFRLVPQTVVTSPRGTVLKVWSGRLDDQRTAEVMRALRD